MTGVIKEQSFGSNEPRGVGGWLLFFCVVLTIIGPLFWLINTSLEWENFSPRLRQLFPSFIDLCYVETFVLGLILLYGIVTGFRIWSGNVNGKVIARQYLKIRFFGFLVTVTALILIGVMLGLPSQLIGFVAEGIPKIVVSEGGFFFIWWFYFKKSKRVKNTYGEDLELGKGSIENKDKSILKKYPSSKSCDFERDLPNKKSGFREKTTNENSLPKSNMIISDAKAGEAQLKRAIFSNLLKEEKDEATMLQAKIECGDDPSKVETLYYRLRYEQVLESGEVNEIKKRLFKAKKQKSDQHVMLRQKSEELNDVVKDLNTGFEWVAGPDKNTNWHEANAWVEDLNVDGGKWRMPTMEDLQSLHKRPKGLTGIDTSKLFRIINFPSRSRCSWCNQTNGDTAAWCFDFQTGTKHSCNFKVSASLRSLAVRYKKNDAEDCPC